MTMTAAETPAPKRGFLGRLLRMILFVLAAILLVAAGFGGGYVYFGKPMSPADDLLRLIEKPLPAADAPPDGPPRAPRPQPKGDGFVTSYYTFSEPLVSNLRDSRRFLQITISVATDYDKKVLDHVKTHETAIRADALLVLSAFTEDMLKSREGRDRLAAELRDAINARLEAMERFGGIKEVIFPAFVLQ
jgi:flagellar protein FliL